MCFPLIYLLLMGPFANSSASKLSRMVCVCGGGGGCVCVGGGGCLVKDGEERKLAVHSFQKTKCWKTRSLLQFFLSSLLFVSPISNSSYKNLFFLFT